MKGAEGGGRRKLRNKAEGKGDFVYLNGGETGKDAPFPARATREVPRGISAERGGSLTPMGGEGNKMDRIRREKKGEKEFQTGARKRKRFFTPIRARGKERKGGMSLMPQRKRVSYISSTSKRFNTLGKKEKKGGEPAPRIGRKRGGRVDAEVCF